MVRKKVIRDIDFVFDYTFRLEVDGEIVLGGKKDASIHLSLETGDDHMLLIHSIMYGIIAKKHGQNGSLAGADAVTISISNVRWRNVQP